MATMTRDIVIDAPPSTVWRHVTDPRQREQWLGGQLDIDLVPGSVGSFRDARRRRPVRVDELQDGRSITYTWGRGDATSQVRIEVVPEGDGSRVRVTESTTGVVLDDCDGEPSQGPRASARLVHVA